MKFSIVTPTYNSECFLTETIKSVISQCGDFAVEYFIVDNISTDRTRHIVDHYKELLVSGAFPVRCNKVDIMFISEMDSTMYEAIQKGFSCASGDIHAWINSDDIYLPGAFDVIQRTFSKYANIFWLKGITSYIDKDSKRYGTGKCHLYQQDWLIEGVYGPVRHFVQQDSVFWRAELLKLSGGINPSYFAAGDFALWRKFAQYAPLYSLNHCVSCFRKVSGQKSEDILEYWQEVVDYKEIQRENRIIKKYFIFEPLIPQIFRTLLFRVLFGKQEYYLVLLKEDREPCLKTGEYYMVKKYL